MGGDLESWVDSCFEVRPHAMRKASLDGNTWEQENMRLQVWISIWTLEVEARQSVSFFSDCPDRGVDGDQQMSGQMLGSLSVICERNSGLACLVDL